jgi:hypothetical protein
MLMLPHVGRPLQCRPVGQTPIYDQLCGEQVTADAPATGADPQRAGDPGKHRLLTDGPGGVAAFEPSEAGVDLAVNQHDLGCTYPATAGDRGAHRNEENTVLADHSPATRGAPAGQPADGEQRAAAGWGPQIVLPPPAHARHAPADRLIDPCDAGDTERAFRAAGTHATVVPSL